MTNPNDAIGTNAAYGTRTSVNAFNDMAQIVNGRGILSGFAVVPKTGMIVSVGGSAGTRDVAIAEDNLGNRVCLNNRLASEIDITIPAASVSSDRYDAIVVYENNPAQASDTTPDGPGVCGIIVVSGNSTGVSEAQIRSAITADGGTGSVAYYATLATIKVTAGMTTITSGSISQNIVDTSISVHDGAITTPKLANGAITDAKLASALESELFYKPGDTLTFQTGPNMAALGITMSGSVTGALTGGNKNFYFEIPIGKSLEKVNGATITSLRGPIRGNGGYLSNSSSDTADIVTNASTLAVDVKKERNCLMVLAIRSAGWGGTNNSTYNFQIIDGSITFN